MPLLLREVRGGERGRQTTFCLNGSELRLWCWYQPFSLMGGTFYLNIIVDRKQRINPLLVAFLPSLPACGMMSCLLMVGPAPPPQLILETPPRCTKLLS